MIRRFLVFYKPYKLMFFIDMLCVLLVGLANLCYPYIVKNMINDYVPNGNVELFLTWAVILLIIYIAKAGFSYYTEYYGHVVGLKMQANMRNQLFSHLQKLPLSYFDEHQAGDLMSRLVNDLLELAELAHHGPEHVLLATVMFLGSFIILSSINLTLTCLIFAAVPIVLIFALAMQKKMDEVSTRTREELSDVNSALENSLAGIRVTRAYTNSHYENNRFDEQIQRFLRASEQRYRVMSQLSVGVGLFTDLLYFVVMCGGGYFFFRGELNVGEFTMFLLYINTFLTPIGQFWSFFERLQSGMTGFRRVLEIMDEDAEPEDPNAIHLTEVEGIITFEDVSFSYKERAATTEDSIETKEQSASTNEVISHLNLHIAKGKTVALVGPSGGGKTTLCHLIPRFYDVSSGCIRLDGQDISTISRESLRQHIGIVAQDVFLFTGSVRENIAYGDLAASDEEIISAAKKANIHDFITSLPAGYDTFIGERGVMLSGGQKQRLSIARVFLKNPKILILDEATSALDNATEMLIQEALEDLAMGRTTIIVAHRLSTIKNADEIIVLTPEGIAERGNHEELLSLEGIYANLYQHQFKE